MRDERVRLGRQTWQFTGDVRIVSSAVAVGPKEAQGPLAKEFDLVFDDLYLGEKTWEKAERKLLELAVQKAIDKGALANEEIDVIIAGDLLNQIISATFATRSLQFPYLGVYGACSTSMEALALAAALVNAGYASYAVAACSSHNCTAEKQYRYPTEYGGQKPPYAQWTVTGAGAAVVGKGARGPRITHATIGKVIDWQQKDPFDMGSAMAPAAADTIATHFRDTARTPQDYDLIATGDLASVGTPLVRELLAEMGYDIGAVHRDCGLMIYRPDQGVFAGGSGCASSAVVTYSHIVNGLNNGTYRRVLIVATGALLSPITYQQGESIPCIAHAVALESTATAKEGSA